jgi:hypothetical protein
MPFIELKLKNLIFFKYVMSEFEVLHNKSVSYTKITLSFSEHLYV